MTATTPWQGRAAQSTPSPPPRARVQVSEEAILAWADEKEHAAAEERVYLEKASDLVKWLREDEDDDDGDDDEDEDEDEEGDE